MRAELQSVLNSIAELDREQLPELLGELEVIRATCQIKLSASVSATPHDELLTVDAAAERLGVSADYLYRHQDKLPFTRRMGRKLLFSSVGIDAYLRKKGTLG
jgi:excisionase family DNA binding protein